LPHPWLINERVEWAYKDYNLRLSQAEWLPDDKIPVLSPYTGTEIFAEAFGCKVHYPDNNMPFALAKYKDIKEASALKIPNLHDTPLDNLFEMARRLLQKAGDGATLHLPDIQSPLDIAALILNKEEFYVAMLEEPKAIHELTAKTKELLTAFLDEWFAEFGTSYIAHFPSYYMEGGVTLSEDEVGAFGSGMFEEFVLGTLNEFSDRYDGIGIHCCANSEHQWQNFAKVKNLRLINLVNNARFIRRSIKYFGGATAHWPMDGSPQSENNPAWLADCPDDIRVVLTYRAADRRSAIETAKRAEELCDIRNSKYK
jgi:uroporphyrinogen-III decarboxylase